MPLILLDEEELQCSASDIFIALKSVFVDSQGLHN